MGVVGRLNQYASIVAYEFDETTANNMSITGLGTYYATEFNENVVDIVRDGLVLNLDAGNLASYPGSGTTWTDVSSNGNNGTLVNGTGYNSANGGSLSFNGSTHYVTVANSNSLNPPTNTLICWAKSDTSTWNENGFLMSKRDVFVMHPNAGSTTVDYFYRLNNAWVSQQIPVSNITVWNMYACSWDGTNINAYLNGTLINSGVKTGPLNTSDTGVLEIGKDDTLARYLDGNIAQASIYNRALTAAEIQQNYNALATRYGLTTTGTTAPMSANVFPPYDLVYDEFGGTFFGAGQGRYMRQNTDKSVIVYNEIDEITPIVTTIPTTGLQLNIDPATSTVSDIPPIGQQAYTTAGTFSFTVPVGCTSISAVCVGAGGGGGNDTNPDEAGSGGGGGGLAYQTSIAVTPGESLTVVVGSGGGSNNNGGDSYIQRGVTNLVRAGGGGRGQSPDDGNAGGSGGTVVVGTGGAGGAGGATADGNTQGAGGGGAGGYSGAGGTGQDGDLTPASTAGAGGGGGGGGQNAGGGGVGILGSGTSGNGSGAGTGGLAGSGGTNGSNSGVNVGAGGTYGGGGAGAAGGDTPGSGASGAVRIIFGSGRSYPSTSVADATAVDYKFTLSDLSGNGRTAITENGPTRNASLNGGVILYDGINDYMTVTSYKGVTGTGARTSIIWFKSNLLNDYTRLLGWGSTAAAGNKWSLGSDSTTYKLRLELAGGAFVLGGTTTPNLTDGQWHMVAASSPASGTVNDIKIYVDGDLLTDVTRGLGATAINTSSSVDVSFGASLVDASPEYLNGRTSQVLIYNVQLTDLEIKEVYKTILGRFLL
jgi:hypothetical protein